MNNRYLNQKGLIDERRLAETRFIVVGAGAIGSYFTVGLAKMGAKNITVYDFDYLEDHNFANQMYPTSQLGKPKVDALEHLALEYGDCRITKVQEPWNPGNANDGGCIVSAVDNMDVRSALWSHYAPRAEFFLDGRMSGLVYSVYGISLDRHEQIERYHNSLFPQSEGSQERCGHKSIIFTVYGVAMTMLTQVRDWVQNEPYRPSYVVYDAQNQVLTKEYDVEPPKPEVFEDTGASDASEEPADQDTAKEVPVLS